MSFKIQQGDLVWAKVKGYPWWPGMVNIFSKRACNCSKSSFKAVFGLFGVFNAIFRSVQFVWISGSLTDIRLLTSMMRRLN